MRCCKWRRFLSTYLGRSAQPTRVRPFFAQAPGAGAAAKRLRNGSLRRTIMLAHLIQLGGVLVVLLQLSTASVHCTDKYSVLIRLISALTC